MSETHDDQNLLCGRCDTSLTSTTLIECSCDAKFCGPCFDLHIQRIPENKKKKHQKVQSGQNTLKRAWKWATGNAGGKNTIDQLFKLDEGAKWFGLHVSGHEGIRVSRVIETRRFENLAEASMHASPSSPNRQFPSLVSFIGDTGVGKSTIIRYIMWCSAQTKGMNLEPHDGPVPGISTHKTSMTSTTGEVNLYPDPSTFGTMVPRFYVDCEGINGNTPLSSGYQMHWFSKGRQYLFERSDGKPLDRRQAVETVYPRFLYIFSDVVCILSRNLRGRTQIALRLLKWSQAGARHALNQSALPAAIIIINAPDDESEDWVSEDLEAMTNQFFHNMDKELESDEELREMAKKEGDETLKDLLLRNFSRIHVHFMPNSKYGTYSKPHFMHQQGQRLFWRINKDSEAVQDLRAKTWTRFDTKQLSVLFDHAFQHLALGDSVPFDFSIYRQKTDFPDTAQSQVSDFIRHALWARTESNFDFVTRVIGSTLVRREISLENKYTFYSPSAIFDKDTEKWCFDAFMKFADEYVSCAFIHSTTGRKCVNTRVGHARGHQDRNANFLENGKYVEGEISALHFIQGIKKTISQLLREISDLNMDHQGRKEHINVSHKRTLQSAEDTTFWVQPGPHFSITTSSYAMTGRIQKILLERHTESMTEICFACLFGRPEYCLPCGHYLCKTCLCDFGTRFERYPDTIVHESCIFCVNVNCRNESSDAKSFWPFRIRIMPKGAGSRVLSLDGGGVRGIIQLEILKRLEDQIGLGLPVWYFFDLIVGTSAAPLMQLVGITGGLIALGMATNGLSAANCIYKFRDFCESAFKRRWFTDVWGLKSLAIYLHGSIYDSDALEKALKEFLSSSRIFYGLHPFMSHNGNLPHCPRVAITTTVDTECRLFANYSPGKHAGRLHLKSFLPTWEVARSTSAAPYFFESFRTGTGDMCRDGGLCANNPVQIAVNENAYINNEDDALDLVLSIGSGQAKKPQQTQAKPRLSPEWLSSLFKTFLETMDGERAWRAFLDNSSGLTKGRARRFNPFFKSNNETPLDDIKQVNDLSELGRSAKFQSHAKRETRPLLRQPTLDSLLEVALSLRASLFFFQVQDIRWNEDHGLTAFIGAIYCRLDANTGPFRQLLSKASGFKVMDKMRTLESLSGEEPFKLDITIHADSTKLNKLIYVEVNFQVDGLVPISGFPCTMNDLIRQKE